MGQESVIPGLILALILQVKNAGLFYYFKSEKSIQLITRHNYVHATKIGFIGRTHALLFIDRFG